MTVYEQPTEQVEVERPRRRRRGRALLITLIVLLIVLGVLVVVADRVAHGYAENRIGTEIDGQLAAQGLSAEPAEVSVGGVPFLTQVLAGRYDEISVLLREVQGQVPGAADVVRIPTLDIDATGVSAPLDTLRTGQGEIVASNVNGVGTIDYTSLAGMIGQDGVTLSQQDGKLGATLPVEVLGQRVELKGTANIAVQDNTVQVRFDTLTAEGLPDNALVQNLISGYAEQLSLNVALPALPFGLQVTEIKPAVEGLQVTATAKDVPLNQGA
ncbi:LmeA family phospholipid-binding protein [Catenuloplanes indicus]|uniref:DUF2993 domain-containing protein n=1 Tax=Catenuloplanes indicus TaxID=137267 RepID=A0AAE3W4H6_9ACTN|nr:DUF2993 domain-containing protein [Catenuloplanes indicus]MDQ0368170.1 hypothetical protein [Catenuloplanes indicus]